MQQAFRKPVGKSHFQGLLLQDIGEIQFWGFHFQQAIWGPLQLKRVLTQDALGKLLGKFHVNSWEGPISRVFLLQVLGTTRFVAFSCAASYIWQEGNCNRQGCICTKPVGNLICRLLALHEVTRGFRAQPPPLADATFSSRILMGSVLAGRMILEAIANTTSF